MRTVSIKLKDMAIANIQLGFVGENNATQVIFESKEIFDENPYAVQLLVVTPPEGTSYEVTTARIGDNVIWNVSELDTAFEGDGSIQLVFTDGSQVIKTYNADTTVLESRVPSGTAPATALNWIQDAEAWAKGTRGGRAVEDDDPTYQNNSKYYSDKIVNMASDSEAWAKGTRDGEAVESDDPAYHNNSKYYAESIADAASDSEAYAAGTRGGEAVDEDDPAYHNNAAYYNEQAALEKAAAQAAAETASAAYNVNLLAANYDATKTYAVGEYVIYNGGLYRCISAITTAEAWTAAHWSSVTVGKDTSALKSAIENNNAWDLMITAPRKTDETVGGVTYTWDTAKEVCSLSGKRTASSYCVVFPNNSGLNGFEKGRTYYYYISSSNLDKVYVRMYQYYSDSTNNQFDLKTTSGSFTIPANTERVYIRIQCDIATSVASIDESISFRILNALPNSAITPIRTEEGIGTNYFAPWSVQLDANDKFSLLAMPQNTIAYTLFRYIADSEVADVPYQVLSTAPDYEAYPDYASHGGLNAIFIEKIGRGSFNLYHIYDATYREREIFGYYASSTFYWYAPQRIGKVKIGMLGDSVTKGRIGGTQDTTLKGIPYWVRYETGMKVDNLGVGNMGWISKQYLNQNAIEYVKTLDLTGYDVITLQYGLNDGDISLGEYTDAPATDEEATTIMGAIFRVIDYIYTQNATVQIILINQTVGAKTDTFPYFNPSLKHTSAPDRWTFTDYFEEVRKFCEKYAIPLIDGYKGLNAWNRDTLIGDNVHPTEPGYKVLGRYIAGQIKSMI